MSSMTFFILFVCIIAILFLFINLVFAPHNPYQEKYSIFECGFHSFLGQNRTQFGVKFFIFALVYLLLDLEILLTFPFAVSGYVNNIYGLIITLLFIGIITIGFIYELGKSALKIDSRQIINIIKFNSSSRIEFLGKISKKNNTTLNSKMLSFSFFKSLAKHFTIVNIIVGLSTIIIISLVKWFSIAGCILYYISNLIPQDFWNFIEYFIYGLIGLIWRLGIKGIIEDIFTAPLYLGMDKNPIDSLEKGDLKGHGGNLHEGNSSNDSKENTSSSSNNLDASSSSNPTNTNTPKDNLPENKQFIKPEFVKNERIPFQGKDDYVDPYYRGDKGKVIAAADEQPTYVMDHVGSREPVQPTKFNSSKYSKSRLDSLLNKYTRTVGSEDTSFNEILKIGDLNISDSMENTSSVAAENPNNVNKRNPSSDDLKTSSTVKRSRNEEE